MRTLPGLLPCRIPGGVVLAFVPPARARLVESSGGPTMFETVYQDYRRVKGLLFAFREESYASGVQTGYTAIEKVEWDPKSSPGDFEPPAHKGTRMWRVNLDPCGRWEDAPAPLPRTPGSLAGGSPLVVSSRPAKGRPSLVRAPAGAAPPPAPSRRGEIALPSSANRSIRHTALKRASIARSRRSVRGLVSTLGTPPRFPGAARSTRRSPR
jgi:hypothetical protein